MRLEIQIQPLFIEKYEKIEQRYIQEYIDIQTIELEESTYNFNIKPKTHYIYRQDKTLTITSPNNTLIKHLYTKLKDKEVIKIKKYIFEIINIRILNTRCTDKIKTETPIITKHDKKTRIKDNQREYLDLLKEETIRKYNNYYNEEYTQTTELFKNAKLSQELCLSINEYYQAYTMWDILEIELDEKNKRFYQFIYDIGLGQQNSLGNGYVENV